jgi:hypothetical protein
MIHKSCFQNNQLIFEGQFTEIVSLLHIAPGAFCAEYQGGLWQLQPPPQLISMGLILPALS